MSRDRLGGEPPDSLHDTIRDAVRDALSPTPEELARLEARLSAAGPPVAYVRDATAPTAGEIERLGERLARSRTARPRRPVVLGWVVPLLAAAVGLFVVLAPAPRVHTLRVDEVTTLVDVAQLPAGWTVRGAATVRLVRVAPDAVDLVAGRAVFAGEGAMEITAGDVVVTVGAGTTAQPGSADDGVGSAGGGVAGGALPPLPQESPAEVEIARDVDGVSVEVRKGVAEVREKGRARARLRAGEHWTNRQVGAREDGAGESGAGAAAEAPARVVAALEGVPVRVDPRPTPPDVVAPAPPPPAADVPPPPAAASPPAPSHEAARAFAALLSRRDAGDAPGPLLAAVNTFIEAHPDSALAEEARMLGLELVPEVLPPESAWLALHAWTGAHPDHPRYLAFRVLEGLVAAGPLGDCARARPALDEVQARGSAAQRERAATALAGCGAR